MSVALESSPNALTARVIDAATQCRVGKLDALRAIKVIFRAGTGLRISDRDVAVVEKTAADLCGIDKEAGRFETRNGDVAVVGKITGNCSRTPVNITDIDINTGRERMLLDSSGVVAASMMMSALLTKLLRMVAPPAE